LGGHSASIRSLRLEILCFQHTHLGDIYIELRERGVRLDNDGFHKQSLLDVRWVEVDVGILWSFAVAMDQTLVFDHQEDSKAFMTPKGMESEN